MWPPFESHEGGFDGLHMFGGRGEIQWFTEGVTYGSITEPKWFGPKDGGEEKNITGSRTGLSDQQMVLWHFQMGEVELNMDLPNLKIVPFSLAVFASACKSGQTMDWIGDQTKGLGRQGLDTGDQQRAPVHSSLPNHCTRVDRSLLV